MFRHILVPLDGSGFAEAALPYALEMAAQFDSDITLLRVVMPPRMGEGALSPESANHMIKMREKMEWGALVPYNIGGQLNQHPRAAMAVLDGPDRDKFVEFYDKCVGEV